MITNAPKVNKTCIRCDEPRYFDKTLCRSHYNRSRRQAETVLNRTDKEGNPIECDLSGCTSNRYASGMCNKHYVANRKHNNPLYDWKQWIECPVLGCERRMLMSNKAHLCKVHYQFMWRYGMTNSQVQQIFLDRRCSNGACGTTENLHWDHDHSCCKAPPTRGDCNRGWLCAACNKALGYVQDNPEKLQGLVDHLARGYYTHKDI